MLTAQPEILLVREIQVVVRDLYEKMRDNRDRGVRAPLKASLTFETPVDWSVQGVLLWVIQL